jgi:hypothetical protein
MKGEKTREQITDLMGGGPGDDPAASIRRPFPSFFQQAQFSRGA